MPVLKILWTRLSEPQFDDLRQRATAAAGKLDEFAKVHNEIVTALRDPEQALEKGEPLYKTRKPGGEVRQWLHKFISVSYVIFRDEQVGWIIKYQAVPASWPF
jgi:hypothetical protein